MSNLKVNTINDASGGSSAVLYGVASPPNSMGFRNRIINGDMRIDQRNAGASVAVTTGNPGYGVDRFVTEQSADSVLTVQQVADAPPGFTNSLKVTVSTPDASIASTQYAQTQHKFEGFNVADLGWGTANAQTVTVSFWVKSSVTGQYPMRLVNPDGSRSFPFYITVNAANTWEYKTKTVVGPTNGTFGTNNSMAFALGFSWATGSTYAGGTADTWNTTVSYTAANLANNTGWIATSGATFYITGVQLEAGTVATPFERRDYGRELMMCQRYFEKSYNLATVPGTATYAGIKYSSGAVTGTTTTFLSDGLRFQVTKRSAPAIAVYDSSGNSGKVNRENFGVSSNVNSSAVLAEIGEAGALVYSNTGTAANSISYHFTANAEL